MVFAFTFASRSAAILSVRIVASRSKGEGSELLQLLEYVHRGADRQRAFVVGRTAVTGAAEKDGANSRVAHLRFLPVIDPIIG